MNSIGRMVDVKILKKMIAILSAVMLLCGVSFSASAYDFRHNDEVDDTSSNINMRSVYMPEKKIKASDLGFDSNFEELNDVYRTDDGDIYLLSAANSQIIVLNSDYTLKRSFKPIEENGEEYTISGAQGVYVDSKGIYIADTENSRVLITDENGRVKQIIATPESNLIPKDFLFQPTKVARDKEGYLYILSMGCYYGALLYSPDGDFEGFYGANKVQASALDALSYIWDLLTSNDAKKASSLKKLPYSFVDFCFDSDGYMVNCTGNTDNAVSSGQISKISPNGSTILFKRTNDGGFTTSASVNFLENKVITREAIVRNQNIVAIDVDDNGYMFALDNQYGLVYLYDRECNMITAFGGGGIFYDGEPGTFIKPTSISVCGDDVLVTDADNYSLTVFSITDYGKALLEAQALHLSGDYDKAKPLWEKVIKKDSSNQLAYRGLAMAAYSQGDYKNAVKFAEKGLDYNAYDLAYQQMFKNAIAKNFIWIFIGVILIVVLLFLYVKYRKKHKVQLIKNKKIKLFFATAIHPFKVYEELKYKNQFSIVLACVTVCFFYIAKVLEATASGFLFTNVSQSNYNMIYTLAQTIGLVLLWSVVNWLVSSLFSGKGNFKEVFAASSYALTPLIIYKLFRVVLSYILPLSGKGFLDAVYIIVLIYTFYLLSVAMMAVHEYTFTKFLLTSIVTLFGMVLLVFIGFMIVVLLQQFWNFIYAIYMELTFR